MIALAVGSELEREQFQARALELQRLALLGQLSRALVHEFNHQLSPINFVLADLPQQFKALEQHLAGAPHRLEDDLHELRETLQDLMQGIQALTETARLFGRLAIQTRDQTVHLGDAVMEVVQLVRDKAERAHIHVDVDAHSELPAVRLHTVQLQQMLLNIIVNAIQQIELTRPATGGQVMIQVRPCARDSRPIIRIRVEDDGPGIHQQLWKRIFDLGFTTRAEGGSGLGLHITNSLAESLNSHVYVESSYILWGTVFTIELPITS
jgi:signal transduction histidine kinase